MQAERAVAVFAAVVVAALVDVVAAAFVVFGTSRDYAFVFVVAHAGVEHVASALIEEIQDDVGVAVALKSSGSCYWTQRLKPVVEEGLAVSPALLDN